MTKIIIIHQEKGTYTSRTGNIIIAAIHTCSLSKRYPFCDGSYIKTKEKEQEKGKISVYTQDNERVAETPHEKPRGNPRHERATNSLGNSIK